MTGQSPKVCTIDRARWGVGPRHGEARPKYHVDDVDVSVVTERVQYLDEHGKLITESLDDYTLSRAKRVMPAGCGLLAAWQAAERKGGDALRHWRSQASLSKNWLRSTGRA